MTQNPKPVSAEERFINTMAADVEVLRLVQIAQLARLGQVRLEALAELRYGVLEGASQMGLDAPRTQDNERVRQLTLARAQAFFSDVDAVMGALQTKAGPARTN